MNGKGEPMSDLISRQAVFEIYGITSDDKAVGERTGGVGSTGK